MKRVSVDDVVIDYLAEPSGNVVHRALAAGLIRAERGARGWRLYPISATLAEIRAWGAEQTMLAVLS